MEGLDSHAERARAWGPGFAGSSAEEERREHEKPFCGCLLLVFSSFLLTAGRQKAAARP
jgi:hypothetical protein